jgi:hypothetical protein
MDLNMKTIQAKYVTYQNEGSIITVGFAEEEFDAQNYILLQRETAPTSQDITLGQDKVFIEIDSPLRSAYDAVSRIEFDARKIVIDIMVPVIPRIGYSRIEIDYSQARFDLQGLRSHLMALVSSDVVLKENI